MVIDVAHLLSLEKVSILDVVRTKTLPWDDGTDD